MVVDRQGRDLGQKLKISRRLLLHLALHIHFESQLNVGYFDLLESSLLKYELFVVCRLHF